MIAYDTRDARKLIEDAIAQNGAIEVLKTAVLAVIRGTTRPKARPPDVTHLSAHLKRDIGLQSEPEAPDWTRYML